MDQIQNLRRSVIAMAAVGIFTVPAIGQAQSVSISSMSQAYCVGSPTCSQVRFALDLTGTFYGPRVRFVSHKPDFWEFSGLTFVKDGNGSNLSWNGSGGGSSLMIEAGGPWAPKMVYVTTQMDRYSGVSKLYNGSLSYEILAYQPDLPQGGNDLPPGGGGVGPGPDITPVASPEPGTMLLLGTGLMGVVGAARRRRREQIREA